MPATTGLRERKKDATREALHEAAVRLAVDHGLDRLTVEAIADAANVSRRTFSNYFANKEEALLHREEVRLRLLVDLVAARPASESAWTALAAAVEELACERRDDPAWPTQIQLLRAHPSLHGRRTATFVATEEALAALVADRLERDAPQPVPPARAAQARRDVLLRSRLLASTALMTLRIATHCWIDEPDAPLCDVVREALVAAGSHWE